MNQSLEGNPSPEPPQDVARHAGIRYFDTGQTHGKGISETWVGATLSNPRKEIRLATKIGTRDGEEAMRETERCLKGLKTDYRHVLHIHNLRKGGTWPRA